MAKYEIITILQDGLTAFSCVYQRGQTVRVDSRMRESTLDRNGRSWLDLDDEGQRRHFGRVIFAHGDISAEVLESDERSRDAAEAQRAQATDASGMNVLRSIWQEEDEARRSRKLVTRSRTTAGTVT